MADTTTMWSDLSVEQRDFYSEMHVPTINNMRLGPDNNDRVFTILCSPTEAMINGVCDTGDRLCRTINYRLTDGQYNSIVSWIRRYRPDHPDPILARVPENIQ